MRFKEFKITVNEVSSMGKLVGKEIVKNRTGFNRTQIFLNKIQKSIPFKTLDTPPRQFVIPSKIKSNVGMYDNEKTFTDWVAAHPQGAGRLILKGYFNKNKPEPETLTITKTTSDPFELDKDENFTDKGKSVTGSKENSANKVSATAIQLDKKKYKTRAALLNAIVNNSVLKTNSIGKKVIEIANGISKGQKTFDLLTGLTPGEFTAIRDYAMEYLSVLMVSYELAQFDNQSAFFEHIGSSASFDNMEISFPAGRSNPISDAIATVAGFINPVSGNSIWLSVKGGTAGKGAAFALKSLKIPPALLKVEEYKITIALIELMKVSTAVSEPFEILSLFNKNNLETSFKNYSYNEQEIPIARKEGKFTGDIERLLQTMKDKNADAFINRAQFRTLHYLVTQEIIQKLNAGLLKNITPLIREILQQNFLKLSNVIVPKNQTTNNEINTAVLWPNKELGTGTVSFFNKNQMKGLDTEAYNKITFRID